MANAAGANPIALLAAQFHDALRTISIAKPLRDSIEKLISAGAGAPVFSETEIENLVDSLDDWSLLDASAFSLLVSIFLSAETCQGQAEGFFKCLDVLERRQRIGDDSFPDSFRESFKSAAKPFLDSLFTFFLDYKKQPLSRRWAGLLLFELLEFRGNREHFLACHAETEDFKALGKLIILGMDKILKIVAGRIIAQLLIDFTGEEKKVFVRGCMGGVDDDALRDSQFPLLEGDPGTQVSSTPSGSQWDMAFTEYVGFIETTRESMGKRSPMGFSAVSLTLGEDNEPISEAGNITCNVDSILSIHVPPTRDSYATWIDVDLRNIDGIELVDSDRNLDHVRADVTVNLVLKLKDHLKFGCLFLMDMEPKTKPDAVVIEIYQDESEFIATDLRKMGERLRRRFREGKEEESPLVGALFQDIHLTFPSSMMVQETAGTRGAVQTEKAVVAGPSRLAKPAPAVAARNIPLPPKVTRAVAVREAAPPGSAKEEPVGAVKELALPPKGTPTKEGVSGGPSAATKEPAAAVKHVPPPPTVPPTEKVHQPGPSTSTAKEPKNAAKELPPSPKASLPGRPIAGVAENKSDDAPAQQSSDPPPDAASLMRPPANTKRQREYAGKKPKVPAPPMKPFKVPTMIGASGSKPTQGAAAPSPAPAGPSSAGGASKGAATNADICDLPGDGLSDVEESVRNKTTTGRKKTPTAQKKWKGKGRQTRSSKTPRGTVFDESDEEAELPGFKTAKKVADKEKARKTPAPTKPAPYATASEDISAAETSTTGNKPKQTPRQIAKAAPPPDPLSQSSLPGIINIPSDTENPPKKKGKASAKRKGKGKATAAAPASATPAPVTKEKTAAATDDIFNIPDDSDEEESPPKKRKAAQRAAKGAKGKAPPKKAPGKKAPPKSKKAAAAPAPKKPASRKGKKSHEREDDEAEGLGASPPKKQRKTPDPQSAKAAASKGPTTRRSARLKEAPPPPKKPAVENDTTSELSDLSDIPTPQLSAVPELEGTPLEPISPVAKRVPAEGVNTSDSAEESITISQKTPAGQEAGAKEKEVPGEAEKKAAKASSAPVTETEQAEDRSAADQVEVPSTPPRQQASGLVAAAVSAAQSRKKAMSVEDKPVELPVHSAAPDAAKPVEEGGHTKAASEITVVENTPVVTPSSELSSEPQPPSEPKAAPQLELQITLPEVPAKNVGVNISIEPVDEKPVVMVDLVEKQIGKELASVVVAPSAMPDGRVTPCSVETANPSDEPIEDLVLTDIPEVVTVRSPKESAVAEVTDPQPAPQHPMTLKSAALHGKKTPSKVEETPQRKPKLTPAKRTPVDVPDGWPSPKKILKQTYRKTPAKPPAVPQKLVLSAEQATTGTGTDNVRTASDRSSPGPKTPPPVQQRDPYPKTPYSRTPGTSALKSAPLPRLSDKKVDSLTKKPQIISWSGKGPLNQGRLVLQPFGTVLDKNALALPRESLHVRFAEVSSQNNGKRAERDTVAGPQEELAVPPAPEEASRMKAPAKQDAPWQARAVRPPPKRAPVTPAVIPPSDPPVLTTGELIRLQVENETYRGPDVHHSVEDDEAPERLDMSDEDLYTVPTAPTPRLPPPLAPSTVEVSTPPHTDGRRKIRKIVTVDDEDIVVYEGEPTPVATQQPPVVVAPAISADLSQSQVRRVTDSGSPLPRRHSSQFKPAAMVVPKRKVPSSVDGESSSDESAPKSPQPVARPKLVPTAKQKARSPSPVHEASIEAVLARIREQTPIYVDSRSETPTEREGSPEELVFGAPLAQRNVEALATRLLQSLQKTDSPPPHQVEGAQGKLLAEIPKPTKEAVDCQFDKNINKPVVSHERRRSAFNGQWPRGPLPPPPDSRRAALSKLSEALQQVTSEVPVLVQKKTAAALAKATPRPRLVRDVGGVLEHDAPSDDTKREVKGEKQAATGGEGRFFTAMQQQGLLNWTSDRNHPAAREHRASRVREKSYTSSSGEASTAEYTSENDEELATDEWREEVPPYHRETLRVLDQITQHWVSYLMSSEEKLKIVLEEHRKKAEQVVEQLRQFHNEEEQNKFRQQAGGMKKGVYEECNKTRLGLSGTLKENMVVLGADIDSGVKEQYSRMDASLKEKMDML